MKLKELCGKHILQGVDRCQVACDSYWNNKKEMRNAIAFRLDGITYLAVEDPDDGYRSYCEELIVSDYELDRFFPNTKVICSMMPDDEGPLAWHNDVLVIKDAFTEKVILEVGTKNFDDYYPCCHFEYCPENLVWNQEVTT